MNLSYVVGGRAIFGGEAALTTSITARMYKENTSMTNREYLRTLSNEKLADWLYDEWLNYIQYR